MPVWDIADKFGDTNLLVTNMAQASDLAKCLGESSVALMRGHGFASAAPTLGALDRLGRLRRIIAWRGGLILSAAEYV